MNKKTRQFVLYMMILIWCYYTISNSIEIVKLGIEVEFYSTSFYNNIIIIIVDAFLILVSINRIFKTV